jgi:thiosulfate reductase cytochrome b subunit
MMHGWIFWLLIAFVIWRFVARGRCARGHGPMRDRGPRQESRTQDSDYVDALETRLANLEERLDFTERLLAGRREQAAG